MTYGVMPTWRDDAVVDVDPETGRQLLREELEKPEYNNTGLSVWDVLSAVLGRISEWLSDTTRTDIRIVTLVIALMLAAAVAYLIARAPWRRRAGTSGADTDVTAASRGMSLDDIVASARAADAAADHNGAVVWWFRALARVAVPRTAGVSDAVGAPGGYTATEIASAAAARHPHLHAELRQSAGAFNVVMYGHRDATAEQAAGVRDTFQTVHAATAEPIGATS